jgi:putative sigma-54 modulation protein
MRINVIGKQFEVTEAIKAHAENKASKLPRHFDFVQQVTVRLSKEPHNKGFHCEIVCDVEHHKDFVSSSAGTDLYLAIDDAVEKIDRQLASFKERLKGG